HRQAFTLRFRPAATAGGVAAGSPRNSPHVPETGAEDFRQAGRTHPLFSYAALAQAGSIFRDQRRSLRVGGADLHAFHFTNSSLSRLDRPPDPESGTW